MYFIYRDGKLIEATGQTFGDFLEGRHKALPGERPNITDWENHLTTIFPDVRLKRRASGVGIIDGSDHARHTGWPATCMSVWCPRLARALFLTRACLSRRRPQVHRDARVGRRALAQHLRLTGAVGGAAVRRAGAARRPGLHPGLDAGAVGGLERGMASALCNRGRCDGGRRAAWLQEERDYLQREVPRTALKTPFRDGTVLDVAREVVQISRRGLMNRGRNEEVFLG